jgi:hypothetical protein
MTIPIDRAFIKLPVMLAAPENLTQATEDQPCKLVA